MDHRQIGGADEWADPRGMLRIDRPAPGVVRTRIVGFGAIALFAPIRKAVDGDIAAGGAPHVFHDWEEMTGYDSSARMAMTEWYLQVRAKVASVHVFTKSKLVSMGVSVVAMATGNSIVGHSERRSFDRALVALVAQARRD